MPPKRTPPRALPTEFTVSSKFIGWAIGVLAGLLGAIIAWNQLWDRIDSRWRLETIQAAQDKKIAADIAAVKDKAETDTKRLAQRAEQGRAWLFWSITDSKAQSADQWATVCASLKLPVDTCGKFKQNAENLRQEALAAKRDATDASKDK